MKEMPELTHTEIVMRTRELYWYASVLPINKLRLLRNRLQIILSMVDRLLEKKTTLKSVEVK